MTERDWVAEALGSPEPEQKRKRSPRDLNGDHGDPRIGIPLATSLDDYGDHEDRAPADWPRLDRSLLNDARMAAPAFDREAFPPAWAEWIDTAAEDCGAPPDYVGANLIGVASGVIGNVRRVSPWEGWVEQPHLWIATVGDPSTNKTTAMRAIRAASAAIERSLQPEHDEAMIAFDAKKAVAEAAKAAWKDSVQEAAKKGAAEPKLPANAITPEQPKPPRLLIADASTEEVQSLLSGNPRGLALIRSELAAWLGQFDRYGGAGSDRGFYLETWDGDPHVVDRVKFSGRPLRIPHASLAICGSIQPEKLADIFKAPDDGLISRFLYLFPDPIPPRPQQTKGANERIATVRDAFARLRSLHFDHDHDGREVPLLLRLDAEGLNILQAVREEVFAANQKGRGVMTTWRGKNAGRLLRLALVFEMLQWSLSAEPEPCTISGASVRRAAAYLRYCTAMIERVLGDLAHTQAQRDAASLARVILAERPATFNEREVYQRRGFHHLRDAKRRREAFAELAAAVWIRKGAAAKPGRPASDWDVNPAIKQRLGF